MLTKVGEIYIRSDGTKLGVLIEDNSTYSVIENIVVRNFDTYDCSQESDWISWDRLASDYVLVQDREIPPWVPSRLGYRAGYKLGRDGKNASENRSLEFDRGYRKGLADREK
jgi:hypothetical protein